MSSAGHQPLQPRATVVIVSGNEILLVKRQNETLWALPGGRIAPPEAPETRAVISVAEATGLRITNLQFVGEYAGRVSANQVFLAEAKGTLQPNPQYVDGARWWDLQEELPLQDHVTAIVNLILDQQGVEESDETPTPREELPGPFEEEIPHRESGRGFFYRLGYFVATAGLAARTGLRALLLALRVAGTGLVHATDGVITTSLAFQGTRPRPVKRQRFSPELRRELHRAQGGRCVYCGRKLQMALSHIDHITPVAQGGPNARDNMQLLCPGCNTRKGDRTDQEFRHRYRSLIPVTRGAMPARTVRQSEFRRVTGQTRDVDSYRNFRAGNYYTPSQKVNIGGIVAGVVLGGLLFWLTHRAFTPEDASTLALVSAVLGVVTWAWVRLRAWYTGRDQEVDDN